MKMLVLGDIIYPTLVWADERTSELGAGWTTFGGSGDVIGQGLEERRSGELTGHRSRSHWRKIC